MSDILTICSQILILKTNFHPYKKQKRNYTKLQNHIIVFHDIYELLLNLVILLSDTRLFLTKLYEYNPILWQENFQKIRTNEVLIVICLNFNFLNIFHKF